MSFTEAVKTCFSKYVDFTGRAPRSEFWYWVLFVIVVSIILQIIDVSVLGTDMAAGDLAILASLFSLATLVPGIAVSIRRLHDTDRSGWWLLVTSRKVVWLFLEQLRLDFVPALHRLQGRPAAQG